MSKVSIVGAMALVGLCVWEPALAATVVAQDLIVTNESQVSPKELLLALCGKNNPEPACTALSDLSQDEAWLVLNHACRPPATQKTDPCKTFWQNHGGVLIFNVKTNDWRAEWEGHAYPLKFDVTGAPTLRLKPRQAKPLKVVIEEISPLTYSATPGVPKEDDVAVIAGLKNFLALAGTGIQGLVQTVAFAAAAPGPAAAPASGGGNTGLVFQPQGKSGEKKAPPPPPECSIDPPDVSAVAAQVTDRHSELVLVSSTLRTLQDRLEELEYARVKFVRVAQRAENGENVGLSELVQPNSSALDTAYDALDKSRKSLVVSTDRLTSCQPMLAAYATLLGAPADGRVIRAFARSVAGVTGCEGQEVSALRAALRHDAALLDNPVLEDPVCTQPKLKAIIDTHRDAMKPLVERLVNARQVEEKVWAAMDKAAAARSEVFAAAAVLSREVEKGRRHTWSGKLIRALVVTRPNPELSWSKVQSHEIVMKVNTPYVKELSLSRGAEEKRAYRLESATGQILGYGIGVIYTPLHESTYGAVAVPGGTTKVIGETKRETRAGDLAAFLTYRFMEHTPRKRSAQPTLDFGVGLTSDRPAFFLGAGVEVLRAARIGFGWAPQRISVLGDGQRLNETIVSSTDDIKTVKRFDTSHYYVSFTFALDSLSLFNSK